MFIVGGSEGAKSVPTVKKQQNIKCNEKLVRFIYCNFILFQTLQVLFRFTKIVHYF